jgi:two-component system, chemotaxis family, protein-glutamate methylesterase/glutaminase
MSKIVRVLIVDDSAFMRKILTDIVSSAPDLEVIGTAYDGLDMLKKVETLKPDVITLDIEMPRMDGLTALKKLMSTDPRPVLMISSLTQEGADATIKSLELGAVDFIGKPGGAITAELVDKQDAVIAKIRAAAGVPIRSLVAKPRKIIMSHAVKQAEFKKPIAATSNWIVVIAVSTGGPKSLTEVIPLLPANFPTGILLVQHMPRGFTKPLADRLNTLSKVEVLEAENNFEIKPGRVLIAPGGMHLEVVPGKRVKLNDSPPIGNLKPRADITMDSVARHYGSKAIAVVMTGMGEDGLKGVRAMKARGAKVIAEHERTCIVYGMPRAVVDAKLTDNVVPLQYIAAEISKMLQ